MDAVIPLELYILPSTVIEIDKQKFQEEKSEAVIPTVELEDIVNSTGLVCKYISYFFYFSIFYSRVFFYRDSRILEATFY